MPFKTNLQFKIPASIFDTVYSMPLWQKIVILVISWIIPIALFWYLFLSARMGEIDSISSKIPQLRHEISVLEAKKRQLPQMEKELKEMEKILMQALKLLPEKEDIPSVLTAISSLGNEARLEFQAFRPGREEVHDFYVSIPVSLEFRGPFHNTVVFFDRVSRMARIVHIKDVTMGGAKESSQIWSQVSTKAKGGGSQKGAATGSGNSRGSSDLVQRGSTWVINTRCTAYTYRFLTSEEQKNLHRKKKRKR